MPGLSSGFKYCEQLGDAVESIPSNIGEGFYKYSHPEMARYFRIALGSLGEAQTGLGSAKAQGLLQSSEYDELRRLAIRIRTATGRFMSYLRATDAPPMDLGIASRTHGARRTCGTCFT